MPDDAVARLFAIHGIALKAVLTALHKQPGFDAAKFSQDFSDALLASELGAEAAPDGAPRTEPSDFVLLRGSLKRFLPRTPPR